MRTKIAIFSLLLLGTSAYFNHRAFAAESATGTYLLGSKESMAGFVPPPGVYVSTIDYFYSGRSNAALEFGGAVLSGGVKADVFYALPTVLWVTPGQVLGGNVAFSATAPIGWKDINAGLSLTGPSGNTISANRGEESSAFGDPVLGAMIGWHQGSWHWNIGTLYNAPIGFWERGNPSSIGFNRSSIDTTAAVTWLDPKIGLEISTAAGFTYNFENPDTNYKTGTEFHLEWAIVQNFSKSFGFGLAGYYYQQVTGDSGVGARLGAFEGTVTALGPILNYNFTLGQIPVSTSLTYFKEFDVKNRLDDGDVGMLKVTFPLSVTSNPPQPMK
jgi:hypothetical protein